MPVHSFHPLPTCYLGLFGEGDWLSRIHAEFADRREWLVDSLPADPRDFALEASSNVRVFIFAGPQASHLWSTLTADWLPCLRRLGHVVVFIGIEPRWLRDAPEAWRVAQQARDLGALYLSVPHFGSAAEGPREIAFRLLLRMLTLALESLDTRSLAKLQAVLDEGWRCRWSVGESASSVSEALARANPVRREGLEPAHLWAILLERRPEPGKVIRASFEDALESEFHRGTKVQCLRLEEESPATFVLVLVWP